jgi:hypothetical protein
MSRPDLVKQYHDELLRGARDYIRLGFTADAAVRASRDDIEQRRKAPQTPPVTSIADVITTVLPMRRGGARP